MKIAYISMFYYPTIGGVEQVIKELAERQVKDGHQVHVFCCDSDKHKRIKKKEETVNGVHVHRMRYILRLSLNTFIWPSLLWKFKGDFDIIHSHVSGHDYVLYAGKLARKIGAKHIHTTHCPWTGMEFRPFYLRPFLFLNDLFMNKLVYKRIDRVVAITPWELEILKRYTSEDKITVIPNGTDKILYQKIKKNNFKKKYKITENKMVLFFGRLNPTKGPEKLALAAIEISKKRDDIAFVWVGPDEGKLEEVKSLIKGHKNMYYLPPIRDKKLIAEMYQAADVYVLPSYREGLPLTIFEAMASRLPIVASPVNGIPYEMKEPENGLFADYGDIKMLKKQILKIIDNKKLAEKISRANYEKAKNYQWDDIYKRYMQEYKNLLKKSK
jgi:glycosyltransferase involved in cell wall biosynthesis